MSCLCLQRDVLMEKGIGEKLLRALGWNKTGDECPEREAGSVRFYFKCPGVDPLQSCY